MHSLFLFCWLHGFEGPCANVKSIKPWQACIAYYQAYQAMSGHIKITSGKTYFTWPLQANLINLALYTNMKEHLLIRMELWLPCLGPGSSSEASLTIRCPQPLFHYYFHMLTFSCLPSSDQKKIILFPLHYVWDEETRKVSVYLHLIAAGLERPPGLTKYSPC